MTDKIIFVTDVQGEEHVIIEHSENAFTSMRKSTYEAQQVEHLTDGLSK